MAYIPSEVLREILCRLPAEPLLRFRCVCKEWLRIIDDTSFIRSHLHRQAGGDRIMLSGGKDGIELYTVSLESIYLFDGFPKSIWAESVKKVIFRCVPHIESLPVASCDGLILISHYKLKKLWAVWNPYTRKSIKLPPTVDDKIELHPGRPCSGIGYDPATDDYKVVRVARYYDSIHEGPALRTFVYNLKLGHWRRLDNDLPCFSAPTGGRGGANGVFVNGALHWFASEFRNKRRLMQWIISLDLATENYHLLPLPSTLYARLPSNKRRWPTNNEIDRNLSVVDGCLFLSCNYFDLQLDGWMMMKDTNSWILLFSFTQPESRISGHLQFLAYLKDKRLVLIQHAHNVFLWLDIEKKLSMMVALNSVPLNLTSQVFPASLVRLNDGGHGSIAAKGRKRKRAKDGDDASIAAKGTSRGRKRKRGLKLTLTTTGF